MSRRLLGRVTEREPRLRLWDVGAKVGFALGAAGVIANRVTQELGWTLSIQEDCMAAAGYSMIGGGVLYLAGKFDEYVTYPPEMPDMTAVNQLDDERAATLGSE